MEWIQNIDTRVFLAINNGIANPLFDLIMPVITSVKNWYLIYTICLAGLAWRGGRKGLCCVFMLLVTVSVCDVFNSRFVKELVGRERPSVVVPNASMRVTTAGGKSFPSSHATNNFGAALILTVFYPKFRWMWYSIASTIAFSRVYVGAHYPTDIIAGAVEGTLIAALFLFFFNALDKKFSISKKE